MDEFDFIRSHLAPIAGTGSEGLRDDCAWLTLGEKWLVVSTDVSIEGVHFPRSVKGAAATERAVRVAASDIAAKGTEPLGMVVALTLPVDLDPRIYRGLALGVEEAARALDLPLLGGDTTRAGSALSIGVTVFGTANQKLLRSGARIGDAVYVSGPIGDAALGLRYMQGHPEPGDGAAFVTWETAFLRPPIDFGLGRRIADVASASIDGSDGLLADLAHIARESGVRIAVEGESLPVSDASRAYAFAKPENLVDLATAGDDYVILFTAPEGCSLGYRIGSVVEGEGVSLSLGGTGITPERLGYRH